MKIEICLDGQELRGNQAVKFEVYDAEDVNQGTLTIGKGSIRRKRVVFPGQASRE